MPILPQSPTPPAQIRPDLPLPLSDIVVKLLAKDPRDRYQSADGLAGDLEICRMSWQSTGHIEPFPLGQTDVSDRLLLPTGCCSAVSAGKSTAAMRLAS
jgi:serine/threonine protein kinase